MKVFMVIETFGYEPGILYGIFSTKEKALDCINEKRAEWNFVGDLEVKEIPLDEVVDRTL